MAMQAVEHVELITLQQHHQPTNIQARSARPKTGRTNTLHAEILFFTFYSTMACLAGWSFTHRGEPSAVHSTHSTGTLQGRSMRGRFRTRVAYAKAHYPKHIRNCANNYSHPTIPLPSVHIMPAVMTVHNGYLNRTLSSPGCGCLKL